MSGLRIVTPCAEDWGAMVGGPAIRHCPRCDRSVHRLAALPRVEVDRLLASLERTRVCVRAPVQADGSLRVTSADEAPEDQPDVGDDGFELGGEPCMSDDDPYPVEVPEGPEAPLDPRVIDDLLNGPDFDGPLPSHDS